MTKILMEELPEKKIGIFFGPVWSTKHPYPTTTTTINNRFLQNNQCAGQISGNGNGNLGTLHNDTIDAVVAVNQCSPGAH
ncbi:uncharacterized protein LAJ45_01937 [Morchella importuna]|uniref:uncharacterized protein n=1 Tax=Morchella importuna TaxID=1174673 RepID=UPI001E8DD0A1|nr:uncharacterized protein LAJ45_01937 [Morchella importuna]KAH8154169.1 hypothetical protein LAJ45_01937 [Morchella importuna]